jgi:hypothetical protein
MNSVFYKDPNAELDYRFDWSSWLDTDEVITAAAFTLETGILEGETAASFDDTTATVWLKDGEVGVIYKVSCKITTDAGRIEERTIRIKVTER